MKETYTNDFIEFLDKATTAYQAVEACEEKLQAAGFKELSMTSNWSMEGNGKYYVKPYHSLLVAFTVAKEMHQLDCFRVIATHCDSPGFKVKPTPEIYNDQLVGLNTEVYGGPILRSWFDRPLSMAGKVALKSDNPLKPDLRLIDFKLPLLTIPSLAIHLIRDKSKQAEIDRQKDMLPVLGFINEETQKDNYLIQLIADKLGVKKETILDFDLHIYLAEKAQIIGSNQSLLSAPRIDNLAMVFASIESIIHSENESGINMAVCFDNEEIGSTTLQGADSSVLAMITEKIMHAYNKTNEQYQRMLFNSFMISADGAHAWHPNAPEKNDPTNKAILNGGLVIKQSAKKAYTSDCETVGAILHLSEKVGIKIQKYVNHSNVPGGMTLGPIVNKYLPFKAVDVGIPMLAMHSARELMGVHDFEDSIKLFTTFYCL